MHTDLDGADLDVDVRARAGKKFEAETEPKRRAVDYDGRLSRAGGHGGAVGEERVVDVCVSVIYVSDAGLILAGRARKKLSGTSGNKTLAKAAPGA